MTWNFINLHEASSGNPRPTRDVEAIAGTSGPDGPIVFTSFEGGVLWAFVRDAAREIAGAGLNGTPAFLPPNDLQWTALDMMLSAPTDRIAVTPNLAACRADEEAICFLADQFGALHEVVVRDDLTVKWSSPFSELDSPPLVDGPIRAFVLQGAVYVCYRDQDGRLRMLQRLRWMAGSITGSKWRRIPLFDWVAADLEASYDIAVTTSTGAVFDRVHIAIRSTDNRLHVLNGSSNPGSGIGWGHTDVTLELKIDTRGWPEPSGAVGATTLGEHLLVHYRGFDNQVHQVFWSAEGGWVLTEPLAPEGGEAIVVRGNLVSDSLNLEPRVLYDGQDDKDIYELRGSAGGWRLSTPLADSGADIEPEGELVGSRFSSGLCLAARPRGGGQSQLHWVYWQRTKKSRGGGLWGAIKRVGRRFVDAVRKPFEELAKAVASVVEAIGDVVADIVEAVGTAIENFLLSIGLTWLAGVIGSVFRFVAVVVKGVTDLAGALIRGGVQVESGLLTFRIKDVAKGFETILATLASVVSLIVWQFVWIFLTMLTPLFDWSYPRPLSRRERALLGEIFEDSLSYYVIRVVETGAGLGVGNTIYWSGTHDPTLVHEAAHIWQYQNRGSKYAAYAIEDQIPDGDGRKGYAWQALYGPTVAWEDMGYESQAAFLEDLYTGGELQVGGMWRMKAGDFYRERLPDVPGRFNYSGDRTAVAREAVAKLRAARPNKLTD